MLIRLVFLFALIPVLELVILIRIGTYIGALHTILLVIGTAFLGAALARREGLSTISKIRLNMARGVVPGEELLDGILILVAALVLITPGFLTDVFGFALLVPASRAWVKKLVKTSIKKHLDKGPTVIHY